jgi:hypothetical protein
MLNDDNFYQGNEPSSHNIKAHNNCSSNNHRRQSHSSSHFHNNNHNNYHSIFHHSNHSYRSLTTLFFAEKFMVELFSLEHLLYQNFFFDTSEHFCDSDRNCFYPLLNIF